MTDNIRRWSARALTALELRRSAHEEAVNRLNSLDRLMQVAEQFPTLEESANLADRNRQLSTNRYLQYHNGPVITDYTYRHVLELKGHTDNP